MTMYALAQLRITDPERYGRYRDAFMETLASFGGRLLAADDHPSIIEGDGEARRIVLLSFETRQSFEAWWNSPAYTRIAADRRAGSEGLLLLFRGMAKVPS